MTMMMILRSVLHAREWLKRWFLTFFYPHLSLNICGCHDELHVMCLIFFLLYTFIFHCWPTDTSMIYLFLFDLWRLIPCSYLKNGMFDGIPTLFNMCLGLQPQPYCLGVESTRSVERGFERRWRRWTKIIVSSFGKFSSVGIWSIIGKTFFVRPTIHLSSRTSTISPWERIEFLSTIVPVSV